MLIIPAIDVMDGKCVRLQQGDPRHSTIYADDPVAQAQLFADAGAKIIHIVDLDGAFEGSTANFKIIEKIVNKVDVTIEVGGGIRSAVVIENYRSIGVQRLIVGTFALKEEFEDAARDYSDYLIVGIDAKNGFVATHGWKRVTETRAADLARRLEGYGIREFIYTDIATDGMLEGPNLAEIRQLVTRVPSSAVIASGGVSSLDDIQQLAKITRLKGCIVGKAIYDHRIGLDDLFALQAV